MELVIDAHGHPAAGLVDRLDSTDLDAAVTPAAAGVHRGVIALEVRPGEAAREALLETREPPREHGEPLRVGERRVERLAVDRRRHGDVGRVLHAALDLERGDPGGQQGGQRRHGGEVGGRQRAVQLAGGSRPRRYAGGPQRVGGGRAQRVGGGRGQRVGGGRAGGALGKPVTHAAGLAAAPAVAAAPRGHARQQAGAGVPVAQGAVDEGLEGETVGVEGRDLVEGELTGQDGARKAELGKGLELGARVRIELRAGVQFELRVGLVNERRKAEVGDDEGVEAGAVGRLERREGRLELVVFEQHVKGEVDARAEEVRPVDRGQKPRRLEVAGEGARAPGVEPQIDRVGAGRQGRPQSRRPPGRRQQLGPWTGGEPGTWRGTAQSSISFHSASRRTRMRPDVGTISTP